MTVNRGCTTAMCSPIRKLSLGLLFVLIYGEFSLYGMDAGCDASMLQAVRADWYAQEQRLGRAPDSPQAIQSVLRRAAALLKDMRQAPVPPDLTVEAAELRRHTDLAAQVDALDDADRIELYDEIRAVVRRLVVKNPLVASQPIVFMQRHRAVGYMLYEYLGWYYAYGFDPSNGARNSKFSTPPTGGGVYVLQEPGRSMKVRELTGDRLGPGHFVTLSMSFDARTLYFAFADPTGKDPYTLPGYARLPTEPGVKYNTFHIYAMDADGSSIRQLTEGPDDDFDPCPLPDGAIAFESTRRGSKLRCGGGSPEFVYTLHRMDADGRNIRTLSFHETHEWHPAVLNDGRIVYTRWDYVDRNAAKFHGLWTCNPDGTNPAILFGNYTTRPWASYQAKAIPGSNRVVFVGGGHHANVGGTLVVLDPSGAGLDEAGHDRFDSLEWLTPEVCFAEAEGWPKSYFYSPWPLAEGYMLVSFSHEPLPGGYTGSYKEGETGIYYMDRFGNLELLFRRKGISSVYPIPLKARPTPPIVAQAVEPDLKSEGEFLLTDVNKSLFDLPDGRQITALRVVQLLPKSRTDHAADPRIGHPNEANARMLLGTVPVEADGSAYFRAPALKPLYFQAVDETGRAVQGMRSVVYLQPGERRSCIGCHEPPGSTPAVRRPMAASRAPSIIQPGPDGALPFSYPRLVQPVLDRHCVRCHDGSTGADKSPLVLTGDGDGWFSASYNHLEPYLRWPSYDEVTRPGRLGADSSPLTTIICQTHRKYLDLPDEALRRVYLWLDLHVPFYGTYEEDALIAQRQGQQIPPPALQ